MTRSFIVLLFIGFMATSCSTEKRYAYATQSVHNPMFREKGEAYTSAYFTTNGDKYSSTNGYYNYNTFGESLSGGVSLQGGYAFSDKFGITGGFHYLGQRDKWGRQYVDQFDTLHINYNRTNFYLAGVFFTSNPTKKVAFNMLAGINVGKLNFTEEGVNTVIYSNYYRSGSVSGFLQPCLNFHTSDLLRFGFSTRFNLINYHNGSTDYTTNQLRTFRLDDMSTVVVTEFGSKISFGFKKFPALMFDGSLNLLMMHSGNIYPRGSNLSAGITYQFKKKKS